mmetsp:Transcript_33839/g.77341  ORF Transcript_33839/g.77341 Transcript_33839/m.77341 type:complete len:490 (+) Transcript_33839:84-1553(+)
MHSEPSSLPAVPPPDLARQPQHWPRSSDDILESLASADLEPLHTTTADEELSGGGDLDTVRSEISSLAGGGGGSLAVSAVGTIAAGVRQSIAHWRVLLFGQGIALSFALAGAASEELNGVCGVSIPLSQTSLVAVFLSAMGAVMHARSQRRKALRIDEHSLALHESSDSVNGTSLSDLDSSRRSVQRKHTSRPRPRRFLGFTTIHAPWWSYFLSAVIAVEGRYLMFLSFRYTSFTFIFLATALAVPSAMTFSRCLLHRTYRFVHVLGCAICIGGIVVNTVSDVENKDEDALNREDVDLVHHIDGDVMSLVGAVLLGLDDVLSEKFIKEFGGADELLFMKWLFGALIAVLQLLVLELDDLRRLFEQDASDTCTLSTSIMILGGYVVFQVLDIYGELKFLEVSECALLNMSLLTSDLWAVIFSIVAVGFIPPGSYYVALFAIVSGIVVYESASSPAQPSTPYDIDVRLTRQAGVELSERPVQGKEKAREIT